MAVCVKLATVLAVLATVTTLCQAAVSGAGRAFPIDSENYVSEKFGSINSRLEWDQTNFLVDLAGHYANCQHLYTNGRVQVDRQTPEGESITGFAESTEGTATDVDAVNGYIRTLVDRWTYSGTYNNMIRNARRFGCSVRPGCSNRAVVSCLFSPGSDFGGAYEYEGNPEEIVGDQHALAFTPEQYQVAEVHTGNKWDPSHLLENLSGYETSCAMINTDDWSFNEARVMAAEYGLQITPVYGWAPNDGSTDAALHRILVNFKQIQYANQLGCSIIPDCVQSARMYVVVSCIYEQQ